MARDVERIRQTLAGWLPDGDRLTGVRVLSAGHSNETFFLDGIGKILRLPPSEAGLLPPYDMPRQYAVLRAVDETPGGPPVPRVFDLCEDVSVLGDAFFTMEALEGDSFEYSVPDWVDAGGPALCERMSGNYIDAVAALHNQPVAGFPDGTIDPAGLARRWLAVAEDAEGDARLIEILRDLAARPPRTSGDPTRIHGDPKHGNVFWTRDGGISALLDWEMAEIGEPLTDLGYLLSMYGQPLASAGLDRPGWLDEAAMTARWEAATGRTAHDVKRYQLLGMTKIAAIISLGFHLYRSGQIADPRFAGFGTVLPDYLGVLYARADAA